MAQEGQVPTTTMGRIVLTAPLAVVVDGQIYEAADPQGWAPLVGDRVAIDYLASSGQWLIVGKL